MFFLETPRLILVATPLAVVRQRLRHADFSASLALPTGPRAIHFPAHWPGDALVFFAAIDEAGVEPSDEDWTGMLIEKASNTAIGQLGAIGQPDANGKIEIGYGLNPEFHRRGYATEMIGALTAWLLEQPSVNVVSANTAVANLASQRVLEKNGFRRVGASFNDEDGPLHCWERSVAK